MSDIHAKMLADMSLAAVLRDDYPLQTDEESWLERRQDKTREMLKALLELQRGAAPDAGYTFWIGTLISGRLNAGAIDALYEIVNECPEAIEAIYQVMRESVDLTLWDVVADVTDKDLAAIKAEVRAFGKGAVDMVEKVPDEAGEDTGNYELLQWRLKVTEDYALVTSKVRIELVQPGHGDEADRLIVGRDFLTENLPRFLLVASVVLWSAGSLHYESIEPEKVW